MPLVLTHGWPGTIWEMLPSIRALSVPAAHGGDGTDAFDVVVPSIPGFGFSGEPTEGTDTGRTAQLWVALMEKLGYRRFGAYGSDWGARITRQLGARFPDRLIGVITPGTPPRVEREPETDQERAYLDSVAAWSVDETGYQRIQGTKPQTLAYGLTDSPVGLAAWIVEKLRSWSDCGGDVERRFSKDQILTLVSIYWHTRTIGTSVRYYHANGLGTRIGDGGQSRCAWRRDSLTSPASPLASACRSRSSARCRTTSRCGPTTIQGVISRRSRNPSCSSRICERSSGPFVRRRR